VARIVIVDDDLAMDVLTDSLRFRGHDAYRVATVDDALGEIERIVSADLVVLDIIMPSSQDRPTTGLTGDRTAGMEVLREIRRQRQNLPVIAYSATEDASVIDAIADDQYTSFLSKWEARSLRELISLMNRTLGLADTLAAPQPFIVHGHNKAAKLALKNYLQNTLHLPEPIILHEQPNLGRTIVEKFEDHAAMSSLVFVLLTPDDVAADGDEPDEVKRRARQNVIFEMGYFLGTLGRRSGRVLLLYHSPLELPSDLAGVVYIDISQGIEAAGEKIRREVQNVRD
jgi:predicted nucleotide-binding protein